MDSKFTKFVYYESRKLFFLFLIVFAGFIIVFYKENIITTLKFTASLFLLFVVPGFYVMLYYSERLDFLERTVIGAVLSAALFGIISYYLNLIEMHIKYYSLVIPLIIILIGLIAAHTKYAKQDA